MKVGELSTPSMCSFSTSLSLRESINIKLKKVPEISVLYKYKVNHKARIKEKTLKWGVINSINVLFY